MPTFNSSSSWLQVGLRNVEDDQPFKNIDYILKINSGKEIKGSLSENGESEKVNVDESGVASVEYIFPSGEPEDPYKEYKTLNADFDELIASAKGGKKS